MLTSTTTDPPLPCAPIADCRVCGEPVRRLATIKLDGIARPAALCSECFLILTAHRGAEAGMLGL